MSQLHRTGNVTHTKYWGDGLGRDFYITFNNGGLDQTALEPKPFSNGPGLQMTKPRFFTHSSGHSQPRKEASPCDYAPDGNGRDSYIIQNFGLKRNYKSTNKQTDYQMSLRDNISTPMMDKRVKMRRDGGMPKDMSVFNNWTTMQEQLKNQRKAIIQKAQVDRLGNYPKRNTVMGQYLQGTATLDKHPSPSRFAYVQTQPSSPYRSIMKQERVEVMKTASPSMAPASVAEMRAQTAAPILTPGSRTPGSRGGAPVEGQDFQIKNILQNRGFSRQLRDYTPSHNLLAGGQVIPKNKIVMERSHMRNAKGQYTISGSKPGSNDNFSNTMLTSPTKADTNMEPGSPNLNNLMRNNMNRIEVGRAKRAGTKSALGYSRNSRVPATTQNGLPQLDSSFNMTANKNKTSGFGSEIKQYTPAKLAAAVPATPQQMPVSNFE